MKTVICNHNAALILILVGFHLLLFLSSELVLVLILSDIIIVWIVLRFGLSHTSMNETMSNSYLIYYVIIPSAPLLVFSFYDWFTRGSSTLYKCYASYPDFLNYTTYYKWVLLLSRLAKLPVFIFHYWLPKAHVQASTTLSMVLARLSLKVRLLIASHLVVTYNVTLHENTALIIVLLMGLMVSTYTRTNAPDLKVFLAYCSVSHMTLSAIGLVMISGMCFKGAWLIRLGHCISSPLLFFVAGNAQYKVHSRVLQLSKGTKISTRRLIILVLLLIDLPFPPSFSFWGELMLLSSVYSSLNYLSILLLIPLVILLRGYEFIYTTLKYSVCSSLSSIMSVTTTILIFRTLIS